jgi:hypothetical protein
VEESDDEDVIVPGTAPGTAPIIEESQGGDAIFVELLNYKGPVRIMT